MTDITIGDGSNGNTNTTGVRTINGIEITGILGSGTTTFNGLLKGAIDGFAAGTEIMATWTGHGGIVGFIPEWLGWIAGSIFGTLGGALGGALYGEEFISQTINDYNYAFRPAGGGTSGGRQSIWQGQNIGAEGGGWGDAWGGKPASIDVSEEAPVLLLGTSKSNDTFSLNATGSNDQGLLNLQSSMASFGGVDGSSDTLALNSNGDLSPTPLLLAASY